MESDSSVELQKLIDRFEPGDMSVKRELMRRAIQRLQRLAAKMLGESFPQLRGGHDVDSIVNETWIRLSQALEQTSPPTVEDFFRLAAHKIRHVLLDMAARQSRIHRREKLACTTGEADRDAGYDEHSADPLQLAIWTEFHARVPHLPEDERRVFDMHYYLEIPQSEIARLTGLSARQVSRFWIKALDRLTEGIAAVDGLVV
ncbi:MAG: sigma-70 family RNA polymerase sigma factor [Planctomycetes bacterium]|nr:sigma-70 family RNA polymerase sigma factor [Planctomycetota bacterium]